MSYFDRIPLNDFNMVILTGLLSKHTNQDLLRGQKCAGWQDLSVVQDE